MKNVITWNSATLKRVWNVDGSKTQKGFKTLALLLADKENFGKIQAIREAKGRGKITQILK